MEKHEIVISQTGILFGDAKLTLFRIMQEHIAEKTAGRNTPLFHSHVYYECHLLINGKTVFQIEEKNIELSEKQLLIIPPMQEHLPFHANVTLSDSTTEQVLGLTLEPADGENGFFSYFQAALMQASCVPITLPDAVFDGLLQLTKETNSTGLRQRFSRISEAHQLIFSLFDTINGCELPTYKENAEAVEDTMVRLDWMVNSSGYSLRDISAAIGYSYRHTARLICEVYGDSLTNVRRNSMLSSAKVLLTSYPEMTVEEVAQQTGFSGAHMLIRAFRAVMDITPTEYRRQHLHASDPEND